MSLNEAFEKACPVYLFYGMTYEQYWEGDVHAHKAFRKAEKMRVRQRNTELWLQGQYIYEALIDVTPYLKAFSKSKPRPYRDKPYDLFDDDRKRREAEEQRERYDKIREKVAAFAKAFNEKRKEREVEADGGNIPVGD